MSSDPFDSEALRKAFGERPDRSRPEGEAEQEPSPEQIWDAVRGELDRDAALALLDRSVEDPQLALEWRLAKALGEELDAETGTPVVPLPAEDPSWHWRPALLVAASLLVATLTAVLLFPPGPGPSPVFRAGEEARIESLLPAGSELSAQNRTLRWQGPEGARYTISVLRADDLREVFQRQQLSVSQVELPPAVLEGLAPGTELLWRVEAVLGDGRKARSETFRLRWSGK